MAKQKRTVKKEVNSAAKKKSKKTGIDAENKVNDMKLQKMKSVDETQKPTMNGDKKKKKEKETKKQPLEMNDVKIQVSICYLPRKLHRQRTVPHCRRRSLKQISLTWDWKYVHSD